MRSLRGSGKRRGTGKPSHNMPALIPMIDMLVILVVYMLVHTADYEILPNTKNISIPLSDSESKPHESTVMMITRDTVFVNGQATAQVADIEAGLTPAVDSLRASLKSETARRTLLQPNDPSAREVTVMADKSLPYELFKKIMMTATSADIGKMSLAVIEKERAYRRPDAG